MRARAALCLLLSLALLCTGPLVGLGHAQVSDPATGKVTEEHEAWATTTNVLFYTPGRVITCVTSGVLWIVSMGITFGSVYEEASRMVTNACTYKLALDGEDMKEAVKEPKDRERP